MAAVTLLGTATFNTTSGTKTVTATPAVGDLIVIVTAHSGNTSTAAPTDNNSSGTYTLVNSAVKATSADTMRVWVRDSLIASATSTTFTHAPGTTTGGGLVVLKITGMSRTGSSAIVRSAIQSNQAAGGTPAPVLGATPGINNAIIGAVFNATNPATLSPRTNYTERADLGYNTPATGLQVMTDDSGETSATITWGSTSASAFCSIAVEIDARVTHDTTGALPGLNAAIAGTAAHIAKHDTSGTLSGPGSATTGSATRYRQFSTSGALPGLDSAIDGVADREPMVLPHTSTGDIVGPGAAVAGSAARFRAFSTSGALTGQLGTIDGVADHEELVIPHVATGAITGPGSAVAGTANRIRAFSTSGALAGQSTTVAGTANRIRAFSATGDLTGPGAVLAGDADHEEKGAPHVASGNIVGLGAVIVANADHDSPTPDEFERGDGWVPQIKRKRRFSEEREERQQLRRLIEQAIDPVTETEAKVVTVKGEVAVVTASRAIALPVPPQFDAQAVAKIAVSVLEAAGIEAKRAKDAENRRRAMVALEAERVENERRLRKRRRDEEILLLMG